jgi:hypothetical protein
MAGVKPGYSWAIDLLTVTLGAPRDCPGLDYCHWNSTKLPFTRLNEANKVKNGQRWCFHDEACAIELDLSDDNITYMPRPQRDSEFTVQGTPGLGVGLLDVMCRRPTLIP